MKGRVAVISGGGGGIGRAIAMRFAREGASLVLSDNHSGRLEESRRQIEATGAEVLGDVVDAQNEQDIEAHVANAHERFGRIDIVVPTAAIPHVQPCLDVSAATFRTLLNINLVGSFCLAQACARHMVTRGFGRVIFLGSVNSHVAITHRSAYAAAKGGISMLTKVMAIELGDQGVTVNAIAPGPVETEMADAMHDEKTRKLWLDHLPIKRYATPEDVAEAAMFLASEAAGYINGVELPVDAGFTRTGMLIR